MYLKRKHYIQRVADLKDTIDRLVDRNYHKRSKELLEVKSERFRVYCVACVAVIIIILIV